MKISNNLTKNLAKDHVVKNKSEKERQQREKEQSKTTKDTSLNRPVDFEEEVAENKQIPINNLNSENDI